MFNSSLIGRHTFPLKTGTATQVPSSLIPYSSASGFTFRRYQCSLCSYSSPFKQNLARHNMSHTGVKPFRCSICHKQFIQKSDMKIHMIRHSGEKPFKCNTCHKMYPCRADLNRHARISHE